MFGGKQEPKNRASVVDYDLTRIPNSPVRRVVYRTSGDTRSIILESIVNSPRHTAISIELVGDVTRREYASPVFISAAFRCEFGGAGRQPSRPTARLNGHSCFTFPPRRRFVGGARQVAFEVRPSVCLSENCTNKKVTVVGLSVDVSAGGSGDFMATVGSSKRCICLIWLLTS